MRKASAAAVSLLLFAGFFGVAKAQQHIGHYVGEMITVAFGFCPYGWAEMNGQLLPIAENEALFTVIGTRFGGDNEESFALPTAPPEFVAGGLMLRRCISLYGVLPQEQ